jgi:hypothetical protein
MMSTWSVTKKVFCQDTPSRVERCTVGVRRLSRLANIGCGRLSPCTTRLILDRAELLDR